jgi:hypothetical protein
MLFPGRPPVKFAAALRAAREITRGQDYQGTDGPVGSPASSSERGVIVKAPVPSTNSRSHHQTVLG